MSPAAECNAIHLRSYREALEPLYLIGGLALAYAFYARMVMLANKNPGAGTFAEYTGDLTERGKRYQKRNYIAMVIAALAAIAAVILGA